jgi:ring-1,2-phenylacetyl-CoA epoxidase subunit PaaD
VTAGVTARAVAETVTDPELPMLTLADLGVLREVAEDGGTVTVSITPTYTGCPAMDTMRDDLVRALHRAGFPDAEVRIVLQPAWSTDWISAAGRRRDCPAPRRPPAGDGPDPAGPRPVTRSGALPALRIRPYQARFVFRGHRMPLAAPL